MTVLIFGLLLFLGTHSVRVFSDDWRTRKMASMGGNAWKGVYTAVSIAGFVAIAWGYAMARVAPIVLWSPPLWSYHITITLSVLAFVLLAAAYVPANHFKAKLGHPMLAGTKLWALAHLLCNGNLADVLLFGSFLVWAVLTFINSRRRDRRAGTTYRAGTLTGTLVTVIVGLLAGAAFAKWLHAPLIGVNPLVWMAVH